MTLANLVKRLEDIMRSDTGIDGTAQRLSQIVWLLFLKAFDYAEQEAEWDDDFEPTIPEGYRWRDWATCENEDGEPDVKRQLTGDALIQFVNTELLPVLRGDAIKVNGEDEVIFDSETPKALLVKDFMRRTINYSQNGIQLRLMVNLFDEVDFAETEDTHEFNDVYEEMLKSLQSAGRAGEFYTPRALTSFAIKHVDPKIKNEATGLPDRVGDFACGTGGFLVDAYRHLRAQVGNDVDADEAIKAALHGQEWKPLPYMLCVTNLMLKGISEPDITFGDALARKLSDYGRDDQMDVIAMNPPYGGVALEVDKLAFPADVRSSETFDLFMSLIIKRLAQDGRAVVILPDGFMKGDGVKATIKRNLMSQCNLHTVIRLPQSCFAPYTQITTNMLFFDKTGPTKETWFYRFDMPEGYKHFSKTKPVLPKHMEIIDEWWDNRVALVDEAGKQKARCYTYREIEANGFNLDLCGYPTKTVEVLLPEDTIRNYQERRDSLDSEIDSVVTQLADAVNGVTEAPLFPMIKTLGEHMSKRIELDEAFPVAMRASILQAAVQGLLTDREDGDEPASKLLERIREERRALVKAKKAKAPKGGESVITRYEDGTVWETRGKGVAVDITDEIPFDIPDSWAWARLCQLGEIIGGGTPKTSEGSYWASGNSGYPWVTPADMSRIDGIFVERGSRNITQAGLDGSSATLMPAGTVIMSSRAPIGYLGIAANPISTNQGFKSVVPTDMSMNVWVYTAIDARMDNIKERASGTTFKEISGSEFGETLIPVPPLAEQRRIVARLNEMLPSDPSNLED